MTLARHKKVKKVVGVQGEYGVKLLKKSAPTSRAKRLPNLAFNLPVDKDGNPVFVKKNKAGKRRAREEEPVVGVGKVREWVDAFNFDNLPTCGIPTAPPKVKIKNLEDLQPISLEEAGKTLKDPTAAGAAVAVAADIAIAADASGAPETELAPSQAAIAAPADLKRRPGESIYEYNKRITTKTVDALRSIQLEMEAAGGFQGENKGSAELGIAMGKPIPKKRSERKKERKKELKAAKQARAEAKLAKKQPGYDPGDAAYKEEAERRAKEEEARNKLTAPKSGKKPDLLSYHEKVERRMEKEREEARASAAKMESSFAAPKGLTKLEAKYAKPDRPGFGEVAHRPPENLSFSRKDKSRVPAGLRINEGIVKKLKGNGGGGGQTSQNDSDREKAIALYRELKSKK